MREIPQLRWCSCLNSGLAQRSGCWHMLLVRRLATPLLRAILLLPACGPGFVAAAAAFPPLPPGRLAPCEHEIGQRTRRGTCCERGSGQQQQGPRCVRRGSLTIWRRGLSQNGGCCLLLGTLCCDSDMLSHKFVSEMRRHCTSHQTGAARPESARRRDSSRISRVSGRLHSSRR